MCQRSFPSRMVYGRKISWHLLSSTSSLTQSFPYQWRDILGVLKVLYNPEAELVGNRMKMSQELSLYDLGCADDIALFSDLMDMLEEVLRAMKSAALRWAGRPSQSSRAVLLRPSDELVSIVESFEHLGSTNSADCSLDKEVSSCISKVSCSFNSLCRILCYQKFYVGPDHFIIRNALSVSFDGFIVAISMARSTCFHLDLSASLDLLQVWYRWFSISY